MRKFKFHYNPTRMTGTLGEDQCKFVYTYIYIKGKGKAIPLQPWRGPEGSGSLRLPDFKTIGT